MVLADTSAWVELLRRTGGPLEVAMRQRLQAAEIATTDVVIMEVLAGATNSARLAGIEQALHACAYLPQRRMVDAVVAADLYRECRRAGETPRQLTDCLVAAVAVRTSVWVLAGDSDYAVLARHTGLEVTSA